MGLFDFLKKGKEEPAPKAAPKAPAAATKPQNSVPTTPTPSPAAKSQVTDPGAANDVYTVQSGDSLSKIAKKLYGDANSWHKLYEANKATIGDNPDLIRPGQRLNVPRK